MKIKLKTMYIIICAVLFCAFVIVMLSAFSDVKVSVVLPPEKPKIIIDAGHGGEDGGAEVDDILEKDINLNISLILRDMLQSNGCDVTTVRDSDISVYSDGADSLSEKKTSDLHNRVNLFNSDTNNIVVSIHQNKFENSKYSGTQVFYSTNNEHSAELAESIQTAVVMLLQPDNTRELKPATKEIYILDQATVPAVIVECGFLSNDEERGNLSDEAYQKKMAYAIMLGIMDYCNKNDNR